MTLRPRDERPSGRNIPITLPDIAQCLRDGESHGTFLGDYKTQFQIPSNNGRPIHVGVIRYRFFILEKNIGGEKTGGMWTGGRRESPVGKETIMVDVTQRSELSFMNHDALSHAIENILDRHEEIQDWTILYTQRELGMRYPGIDFSTASTLAKIATDPGLSKEFDQSLTADAIERMRAVPLPDRPEQRSDAGLPMPDPGIDPNSGNGPMGPGIGM